MLLKLKHCASYKCKRIQRILKTKNPRNPTLAYEYIVTGRRNVCQPRRGRTNTHEIDASLNCKSPGDDCAADDRHHVWIPKLSSWRPSTWRLTAIPFHHWMHNSPFHIFPFRSPYTPYVLHFGPFLSYAVPTQSFLYLISCLIPPHPPPQPLSKGREELRTTSFLLFLFMRKLLFRVSTLSSAIYFHLFSSLFSSHEKNIPLQRLLRIVNAVIRQRHLLFPVNLTEASGFESYTKVQTEKNFFFKSHYYAEN